MKWSADELQPDQIGRTYESDADMIRKLETSLGEKTTAKKSKKKEWISRSLTKLLIELLESKEKKTVSGSEFK